jgi:hypothetical protein
MPMTWQSLQQESSISENMVTVSTVVPGYLKFGVNPEGGHWS